MAHLKFTVEIDLDQRIEDDEEIKKIGEHIACGIRDYEWKHGLSDSYASHKIIVSHEKLGECANEEV